MKETIELIGKLGDQVGAVGVFLLVALVIYLQSQRTKKYHKENIGTLNGIASSADAAKNTSAETLNEVRLIHDRVIRLEEWRNNHDERDNERFKALGDELKDWVNRLRHGHQGST